MTLVPETREVLLKHAAMYETVDFLTTDPSYFMHQVKQPQNQETMALIASVLSYGSRKQFFPKIQYILNSSEGNVYDWIKSGKYIANIPDNNQCYYRLHTNHSIFVFLQVLLKLMTDIQPLRLFVSTFPCNRLITSSRKTHPLHAKEFACFSDGWLEITLR